MAQKTSIEWTATVHPDGTISPGATWNPIRARYATTDEVGEVLKTGWHCERVSPGCQNCYAETINQKRFGTGLPYNRKSREQVEVYLDEKTLVQPLHWRRPRRIFVCSMTDLFGEWVPDEMIDRVFAVMALSPQHTFQVLTKRPERMREYVSATALPPPEKGMGPIHRASKVLWAAQRMADDRQLPPRMPYPWSGDFAGGEPLNWPLPNVWLGTSAEDQERADKRIPELLGTPAAVRFVSAEPLLGPVSLPPYIPLVEGQGYRAARGALAPGRWERPDIDWVIVGGESGPGARPCDVEWIRSIVRQCQAAGVAVFYKQGGYHNRCSHDRKGGHFECFPDDLKVREFPNAIR